MLIERKEHQRLYGELCLAVFAAHEEGQRYGMDSTQFIEADEKVQKIWAKMRKLMGKRGVHSSAESN